MSLSLAYCFVIVPINILLKIVQDIEDSEINSSRINLESNEQYKRKVE